MRVAATQGGEFSGRSGQPERPLLLEERVLLCLKRPVVKLTSLTALISLRVYSEVRRSIATLYDASLILRKAQADYCSQCPGRNP